MKKFLLIMLTLCVSTSMAFAAGNPSDKYKKKGYTTTTQNTPKINLQPTGDPVKAELDSLARQMLRAAENHQDTKSYQMKMMQKGVTGMCPLQIQAKQTPQCPPIKLEVNGRKLSGSKCAFTCYEYKGKQYEIGWCK